MANRIKGVRNLKTLSGKVDQVAVPYRAYMQITCLEMEKARRNSERQSASSLIADIDTRLREIETEKVRILATLSGGTVQRGEVANHTTRGERKGGFRVRY